MKYITIKVFNNQTTLMYEGGTAPPCVCVFRVD